MFLLLWKQYAIDFRSSASFIWLKVLCCDELVVGFSSLEVAVDCFLKVECSAEVAVGLSGDLDASLVLSHDEDAVEECVAWGDVVFSVGGDVGEASWFIVAMFCGVLDDALLEELLGSLLEDGVELWEEAVELLALGGGGLHGAVGFGLEGADLPDEAEEAEAGGEHS